MKFQIWNLKIVLSTPELTSVTNAREFNRIQITKFYNVLAKKLPKLNIGADSVYNMDETEIMTVTKNYSNFYW